MSGEKQKVSPLTEPALPSFQFSIFNYQLDQVHTGSTGFTTHFFRPYTCLNFTDMGFAEVKHTQATLSDTSPDT